MIAYGLRGIRVLDVFEMKKDAGKIIKVSLGYNCGFATLMWFNNIPTEYYYFIQEGDKIEIPKATIKLQKNEYNGKVQSNIIICTNQVEKILMTNEEKQALKEFNNEKEKQQELEREINNEGRFDFEIIDKTKEINDEQEEIDGLKKISIEDIENEQEKTQQEINNCNWEEDL